jgi:flagellar hook-associated protein 3 FlgL
MRISTAGLFESGITRINDLQSSMIRTQQQIAGGKRILTPADDPVGAARALDLTQGQAINTQLGLNRKTAKDALSFEESVLQSVTLLLQDVKTLGVNAGNPAIDDPQRKFLAAELSGRIEELLGLANSRDGMGNYIFSGYNVTAQPFLPVTGGATFAGDQGLRMLQVSPSQQMAINDTGNAIFENIRNGNGTFVAAAASTVSGGVVTPTNTGSAVISPGSVVDAAAWTGHNYNIVFSVAGGVTTYDVVDTTTSTTLSAGNAYTSGQAITFDGIQLDIKGSPANGDSFTVQPSTGQSVFTTLNDLLNTLKAPAMGSTGQANLSGGLSLALQNIDNALDNVLSTRASVGVRLREVESLDTLGDSRDLQYAQSLADIQDTDYAKAITELNMQQTILEAAQKSFVQVTGMSLFKFL